MNLLSSAKDLQTLSIVTESSMSRPGKLKSLLLRHGARGGSTQFHNNAEDTFLIDKSRKYPFVDS